MKTLRLFCLTIILYVLPIYSYATDNEDIYKGLSSFTRVIDLIERNYVDEVDPNELTLSAIEGMLNKLDPYSAYLTPERYKALEIGTSGEFGGIGINIVKTIKMKSFYMDCVILESIPNNSFAA